MIIIKKINRLTLCKVKLLDVDTYVPDDSLTIYVDKMTIIEDMSIFKKL